MMILIKKDALDEILDFETDYITGEDHIKTNWVVLDFYDNTFLRFEERPTREDIFNGTDWLSFKRLPREVKELIIKKGERIF